MIRINQRLGKYKIERKLGEGGFANVYRAKDTIEGVAVALKILAPQYLHKDTLDDFRREVRIAAKLHHPNILPLKNADLIDRHFVMTFPLGQESLADRLERRISTRISLEYLHQLLDAVSHAHEHNVIHCDIKPENLILFPDDEIMLTDFGIAKVALRTVAGSGAGTVGHVAPEQAMGKPSFRSDVFSIGLIAYRMFSGVWPEWPFTWPPPGIRRLRERLHPDLIGLIRRSLEVDQKKRFRDASHMLAEFRRIKPRGIRKHAAAVPPKKQNNHDWRTLRHRQFKKQYGRTLGKLYACRKCHGLVSESMRCCPWCRDDRTRFPDDTSFPECCPRCLRGMKLDWRYCPWCYGAGFEVETNRQFKDARYSGRCQNTKCQRKSLMPYMRYCPWCSRKVSRTWKLNGSKHRCHTCGWGIAKDFWLYCPWCGVEV
jgi:serine/threonine-protein kinase